MAPIYLYNSAVRLLLWGVGKSSQQPRGKAERKQARGKRVSAKLEDYLEAIYKLETATGSARVRDIAGEVAVHKSTVTAALRSLTEKGLVHYAPYERVTLTGEGKRIASEVSEHHAIIRRFLTEMLQIEHKVAEANACRMEHVMDNEVLARLVAFAQSVRELIDECPDAESLRRFRERTPTT